MSNSPAFFWFVMLMLPVWLWTLYVEIWKMVN
jgi:hypothetical protein